MSTREQEARALEDAKVFLYALGNGTYRITSITALRKDARRVAKHFPLAAGCRWMSASSDTGSGVRETGHERSGIDATTREVG